MLRWLVAVIGYGIFPVFSYAAVSISEVTWMGDAVSSNHEWIELSNDGSATDVEGWVLSDGANLSINLSGTIPANSAVVLERTSDETASGAAFLVYTGALVNTGATLSLRDSAGALVDQVSGGENWEGIGGDNATKETAQYTSAGWVTAAATPGYLLSPEAAAAVTQEPNEEEDDTTPVAAVNLSKAEASETVRLTMPDVTLELAIETQSVGYVHQPISFTVEPSGIGTDLTASLQYQWNFGDGETGGEKKVTHSYEFPGTYVVTVYGGFKRQEQVARQEITILPVALSLTTNRVGDVQVNNDSPYEIDISGYKVKGKKEFIFPPRSVILPGQTITIAEDKIGSDGLVMVAAYDTAAALVASRWPESARVVIPPAPLSFAQTTSPPPGPPPPTNQSSFGFVKTTELGQGTTSPAETTQEQVVVPISEEIITPATTTEPSPETTANRPLAFVALAGVLAIGVIGLLAIPRDNQTS